MSRLRGIRAWLKRRSGRELAVFYGVIIVWLAFAAQAHSPSLVVPAVLFIALAVTTREALCAWRKDRGLGGVARRVAVLFVIGVALIAVWRGTGIDVWAFLGIAACYFAVGQLLLAVREDEHFGKPWRSVVLSLVLAPLFALGLVAYTLNSVPWGLIAMGVAVLVAPVAVGLAAEDALDRTDGARRGRNWAYVGAILLLLGLVALVSFGMPIGYALAAALVLFLLVGAIASKTEGDIIVVLLVVLLVWAMAPRNEKLPDHVATPPGQRAIAALGDSFMSGEGAESFFEGTNDEGRNECRRAPTAYAAELAEPQHQGRAADRIPDRVAFIACSGAKAAHINEETQYPEEPGGDKGAQTQIEQLAAVKNDIGLVLLSIGGNDAGFGEIGRACVLPGNCAEIGESWLEGLSTLGAKLRVAYGEIKKNVLPGTPVLVMPYPIALTERACRTSLLTGDEHRFLVGFTRQLNRVVRHAAEAEGFHYVADIEDSLDKAKIRICQTGPDKAGVNFLAANPVAGVVSQQMSPANWFHNSLHPNKRGHEELRKTLVEWIAARDPLTPLAPSPGPEPRLRSTADIMGPEFEHCVPEADMASCRSSVHHWSAGQLSRVLWYGLVPLVLVVAGSFLIWVRLMLWLRRRDYGRAPKVDSTGM